MTDLGHVDIAILGAGIQGCSVALELASRGKRVTLIDQDECPMNRASLRNEGKIHLGLVYGNEPSLATARLQLRGALRFWPLLEKWTAASSEHVSVSTPFVYAVASDSIVGVDDLHERYELLGEYYREVIGSDRGLDYLGARPASLAQRLGSEFENRFNPDRIQAAFQTEERAVDTDQLAKRFREAVERDPKVAFQPGRVVRSIRRRNGALTLDGEGSQGTWRMGADQVVNATWTSRLGLDSEVGIVPVPGWLYRLKYRTIVRLPDSLRGAPSVTMVLGPYGDVVIRADGTAYLSWYPVGLMARSTDLKPPDDWEDPCTGLVDADLAARVADESIQAIDDWYPGIAQSRATLVDAGVIFAYGTSDVDDPESLLHTRTRVGVISVDGYHSMNAGKLTTAPMLALDVADRVCST